MRYEVSYSADLFPYTKYKMVKLKFDTMKEVEDHFESIKDQTIFNKLIYDTETGDYVSTVVYD